MARGRETDVDVRPTVFFVGGLVLAADEYVSECGVEVFGGADELVVDAASGAASADGVEEVLECAEVTGAECGGVAGEFAGVFESFEAECAGVAEFEFFVVEDLEDEYVVSALSEDLEAAEEVFSGAEEVGEEDDDGASVEGFVDAFEDAGDVCFSAGELSIECGEDGLELCVAAAGGDLSADGGVEDGEADGVMLFEDEHAESGGDGAGVFEFGEWPGAELHGFAAVDEESDAGVGIVFELFEVVAVGAGPEFPVDAADIVTGDIFAVLEEFEGLSEPWAAMESGDEAFDDLSGAEFEPGDAGEFFRPQRSFQGLGHW